MQMKVDSESQTMELLSHLKNETEIEAGQQALAAVENLGVRYREGDEVPTVYFCDVEIEAEEIAGRSTGMLTIGIVSVGIDIPDDVLDEARDSIGPVPIFKDQVLIDTAGGRIRITDDSKEIAALKEEGDEDQVANRTPAVA